VALEREDEAVELDRCPGCGGSVTSVVRAVAEQGLERAGCPHCALQLVRTPGAVWRGIRG
jgi:formate dehydrogenase maturation protein FdhE